MEAAWSQLQNGDRTQKGRMNWFVLKESQGAIVVDNSGAGGLSELLENLSEPHEIFWAVIQVVCVVEKPDTIEKHPTFVRFTQVGTHVNNQRRYRVMQLSDQVNELLSACAVHMQLQSDDRVDMKEIALGLEKSGLGIRPSYFDFGGGETMASKDL